MNDNHHSMWAFDAETSLPKMITFPKSYIYLLDNFFKAVDASAEDPNESRRLQSLFTEDGIWKTPSATFSGVDQIGNSGHNWEFFKIVTNMRHWVLKVYVNDEECKQLMLLGRIRSTINEGSIVDTQFGARVEIEDSSATESHGPKLKFFQGWSSRQ